MRLVFHPKVSSDILKIMDYYEEIAGPQLANDFQMKIRDAFLKAAAAPEKFAIRSHDVRRANLERFPYHFLFRIDGDSLRVLVVRHHKRRPSLGTRRR